MSRVLPIGLCTIWILAGSACAQEGPDAADYRERRAALVRLFIERPVFGREPVRDAAVLDAMRTVPRHRFVPDAVLPDAYEDTPLPIGHGQTISQPYIVARMTEALGLDADDRVLEIGSGSGYQAAVLGEIAAEVYTIEIVEPLGERARETLAELGYENIQVRIGDGYRGWPEEAPFDAIIVTAAPERVPKPLIEQLKPGGRMVIPVGARNAVQELRLITKDDAGEVREEVLDLVRFVPFTGEAERN